MALLSRTAPVNGALSPSLLGKLWVQRLAQPRQRVPVAPHPVRPCAVRWAVPPQDPGTETCLHAASKVLPLIYCLAWKLITPGFNNDGLLSSEGPWLCVAAGKMPKSTAPNQQPASKR